MQCTKRLTARFPAPSAFVVVLIQIVTLILVGALAGGALSGVESGASIGMILARTGVCTVFLILLWRLGWLPEAGVAGAGSALTWGLALLVLVWEVAAFSLAYFRGLRFDASAIGESWFPLASSTLAGLSEELVHRGLLLTILIRAWGGTRRGVVRAVVVSGLFFGGLHVLNLLQGKAPSEVGMQIVGSALSSVIYCALVLRGGSIWPAVLMHAGLNFAANAQAMAVPGFQETLRANALFLLLGLPDVALGLWLLRGVPLRRDGPAADAVLTEAPAI